MFHLLANSGRKVSEETRQKISEATRLAMNNPEIRRKLSESHKGIVPWNKGMMGIYSEETKRKISKNVRLALPNPKVRRKMSEVKKGKMIGSENPFFGKHHSEETRRKNSEAHKGKPSWN